MSTNTLRHDSVGTPGIPWADHWLLEAFRRAGNPQAMRAASAPAACAWDALVQVGIPVEEVIAMACVVCGVGRADAAALAEASGKLLPEAVAERYGVVPLHLNKGVLRVASANPLLPGMEEDLRFAFGYRIEVVLATPAEIASTSARLYAQAPVDPDAIPVLAGVLSGDTQQMQERILSEALRAKASDIHVEPQAAGLLVRFRVDGSLYDALRVPLAMAPSLISRFKVTANLDISDRMRPQDGRSSVQCEGRQIDLRISTLPLGQGGEKVVIRILDSQSTKLGLANMGFTPPELYRLEKLLGMREGMILVTGPTGSGKTTTLYSALQHVQDSETNIITVEDPVEYRLEGINQVQVNERAGLTFAAALRSMLRQDPDVILIGEIRDADTAGIALKASMTGHLVLSTLHTNDAPSAIGRLLDIGVDVGALSGAVKGIMAQRLVRKLCTECSEPVALADLAADHQMLLMGKSTSGLRKAVGCPSCRGTGYRGRSVVPEVLVVTPDLQQAIARMAPVNELTEIARQGGMMTLWEAGMERVLTGTTSLHELIDNIPAPVDNSASSQSDVDALLATLLGGGGALAAAAPAPLPAVASARRDAAPAPAPAASTVPPRRTAVDGERTGATRILLVDDDREARQTLRRALEEEGFRVIESADGEAALSYARRLRPDVVITEIALPRLDGLGLLQALREEAAAPIVFVCTTQSDPALLEWAHELGAADVLAKPVDARVVAARIRGRRMSVA